MYPTQKGGHKRAYLMAHPLPEKRTHDQIVQLAGLALESGQRQQGVKGISRLVMLPGFDLAKGFVPDSVHTVWLGVTRHVF